MLDPRGTERSRSQWPVLLWNFLSGGAGGAGTYHVSIQIKGTQQPWYMRDTGEGR